METPVFISLSRRKNRLPQSDASNQFAHLEPAAVLSEHVPQRSNTVVVGRRSIGSWVARRAAQPMRRHGFSLIYLNPLCSGHSARARVAGAVSSPQDLLQSHCFSVPLLLYSCAVLCRRTCSNGDGAVLTLRNCLTLIASKLDQVRYRKDGDSGVCIG